MIILSLSPSLSLSRDSHIVFPFSLHLVLILKVLAHFFPLSLILILSVFSTDPNIRTWIGWYQHQPTCRSLWTLPTLCYHRRIKDTCMWSLSGTEVFTWLQPNVPCRDCSWINWLLRKHRQCSSWCKPLHISCFRLLRHMGYCSSPTSPLSSLDIVFQIVCYLSAMSQRLTWHYACWISRALSSHIFLMTTTKTFLPIPNNVHSQNLFYQTHILHSKIFSQGLLQASDFL